MKLAFMRVTAARTFNHPTERDAAFRHEFTLMAVLDEEDQTPEGAEAVSFNLRRSAEVIAENHKRDVLADIEQEAKRERLEANLLTARRWSERVDRYHATLTKLKNYAPVLDRWECQLDSDRTRIADDIMLHTTWHGGVDQLREHLAKRCKAIERNIAEETASGPSLIASLAAELAALPPLRLLPSALVPDILPGHPDHPDTTDDDEDYPPN